MQEVRITMTIDQVKKKIRGFTLVVFLYSFFIGALLFFIDDITDIITSFTVLNPSDVSTLVIVSLISLISIFLFGIFKRANKLEFKNFSFIKEMGKFEWFNLFILGIAINLFGTFLVSLITIVLPVEPVLLLPIGFNYLYSESTTFIVALISIIFLTIIEEYVFRGIMLKFLTGYGLRFGIIAVSILSAMLHFNLLEVIPAFLFSYFLCIVTLRYSSFLVGMIIHILHNVLIMIASLYIAEYYLYIVLGLGLVYLIALYLLVVVKPEKVNIPYEPATKKLINMLFSRFFIVLTYIVIALFIFKDFYYESVLTFIMNANW